MTTTRICELVGCGAMARSGHSRFCEAHSEHRHTAVQFQTDPTNGGRDCARHHMLARNLLEAERAARQAAETERDQLRKLTACPSCGVVSGPHNETHWSTCSIGFEHLKRASNYRVAAMRLRDYVAAAFACVMAGESERDALAVELTEARALIAQKDAALVQAQDAIEAAARALALIRKPGAA